MGSVLLSALERRDAEELARIQAGHEVALLKRVSAVKEDQIKEGINLFLPQELSVRRHRSPRNAIFYALEDPLIRNPPEKFGIFPEGSGKIRQIGLNRPQAVSLRRVAPLACAGNRKSP